MSRCHRGALHKKMHPTHGSGWFCSIPTYINRDALLQNPTNGSWWMVHSSLGFERNE